MFLNIGSVLMSKAIVVHVPELYKPNNEEDFKCFIFKNKLTSAFDFRFFHCLIINLFI